MFRPPKNHQAAHPPAHSHAAVCKPRRMFRWLKRHSKHLDQAGGLGTDTGASIESWKEPSYVRGLFLSADSDDTGTLTFNEFAEMDLHKGINRVTLKRAFESVDLSRNGKIEMSEFMTYINSGLHIQLIHNMEDISRTSLSSFLVTKNENVPSIVDVVPIFFFKIPTAAKGTS